MQTLDLPGIVAEVREREARLSTPGRAPDDAEPVSSPLCWLEWADNLDERRVPTLAKLCKTTPQVDLLCSICMKKHTSRCRDCGARYCSENCQKQDWKRHKMVCKAFNNWDYSTRPSDDHFLGLVFPTDRKKPELLWCRLTDNATNLETTHPDIHRLRHLSPKGHAIQVNSSVALGRVYLGHGLALLDVYALTENEKDSLLNMNQCVSSLSAPGALALYSGPQGLCLRGERCRRAHQGHRRSPEGLAPRHRLHPHEQA